MAEQAREQTTIKATVEQCYRTLSTSRPIPSGPVTSSRPPWSPTMTRSGRSWSSTGPRPWPRTTYRLQYDYERAPNRLGWELLSGDLERELDGHYELTEGAEPVRPRSSTSWRSTWPIPGFVKRRAEARIIKTALSELKARVEGVPAPDAETTTDAGS